MKVSIYIVPQNFKVLKKYEFLQVKHFLVYFSHSKCFQPDSWIPSWVKVLSQKWDCLILLLSSDDKEKAQTKTLDLNSVL